MEITLDMNQLIIRDFCRCQLDLIYSEKMKGIDPEFEACTSEHRISAGLRHLFSALLPCFSEILIHSSGVVLNDKAAIFIAPSTGGKTTVVNKSPGAPVLSDDQVILQEKAGLLFAHATPFGRITSGPYSARLGGFFLLEKKKSFEIDNLEPVDMLKTIWSSILSQTYFLPKNLRIRVYEILYDACQKVPTYRMRFPKDHVDWDAIDKAMAK